MGLSNKRRIPASDLWLPKTQTQCSPRRRPGASVTQLFASFLFKSNLRLCAPCSVHQNSANQEAGEQLGGLALINWRVSTIREVVVSGKKVDETINLINNGGLVTTNYKSALNRRLVEEEKWKMDEVKIKLERRNTVTECVDWLVFVCRQSSCRRWSPS